MAFHTRTRGPLRAFGDAAQAQRAARAAAARARDFAAAEASAKAEREREARAWRARAREARMDPSMVLPRNPMVTAQQRVRKIRKRRQRGAHTDKENHAGGDLERRPDWGSGKPREFGDGKRGKRWYDCAERRDGPTGSALATHRVKARAAAKLEREKSQANSTAEKKATARKVRVQLAKLDIDCREIVTRCSDEFKRGSFVLLANGAMHKATRQRILKLQLGSGVDVGEDLHSVGWRPGYRNNINGGTRGTKIAPHKVLAEATAKTVRRGAIPESNRAPIGYGGTVRLFSP